jgi:uncharacterized membrane protein
MSHDTAAEPSVIPEIQAVGMQDIRASLSAGMADFRRAPAFGILFSAVYVLGGLVLYMVLTAAGQSWWLVPLALGFPLLAPFLAVGLYDVSRRLERGEPLDWNAVLGVVIRQKDRQIPSMAVVIMVFFMFWVFVAHTVYALFFGLSAYEGSLIAKFTSPTGLMMLAIGSAVGGAMALVLFSLMVISLPLLLDKELDFVTAMITSFGAVSKSPSVMLTWAAIIAASIFVAMLPVFLGLFIVLPVLGHASWHLYRRVLPD